MVYYKDSNYTTIFLVDVMLICIINHNHRSTNQNIEQSMHGKSDPKIVSQMVVSLGDEYHGTTVKSAPTKQTQVHPHLP